MIRDDISTKLIHLTRDIMKDDGTVDKGASDNFINIIRTEKLYGGSRYIRGSFCCVCFSEAPINKFAYLFTEDPRREFRYTPFGVMVEKEWLFNKGGRPVIYQTEEEYNLLHESQKFRHVRYEPDRCIDFTWEREWRIKVDELPLDPNNTTLIVPTRRWERIYIDAIIGSMKRMASAGSYPVGKDIKWHFIVLEDLGIDMPWPDPE